MLHIRAGTISFKKTTGLGQSNKYEGYSDAVKQFSVFLTGYDLHYCNDEKKINRIIVRVWGEPLNGDPNTINVQAEFGIKDNSGNFDDPFSGHINYTIITE